MDGDSEEAALAGKEPPLTVSPEVFDSISPNLDVVEVEIASATAVETDGAAPATAVAADSSTPELSQNSSNPTKVKDKDIARADDDDDAFNLSSEEGQDHLRELNEELRALNEQGSPKLSMLHSDQEPSGTRQKRRRRKRKQQQQQQQPSPCESDKGTAAKKSSKNKVKRRLLDDTDSGSPGQLAIVHDSDGEGSDVVLETANEEIDRILEEKAWKANLSAVNVKNILRYVITNENVLAMVHNSMRVDGSPCREGAFEPKLTRSKAKELLEKKVKVPWPISPLKVEMPSESKNLSELKFSESEASSDEEYRPEMAEMSEEEDSFFSSPGCAATELSPVRKMADRPPSSEPAALPEEALPEVPPLPEESAGTIALRTRSKLPLNDTPLEYIEADFVAPDITTDMYYSGCDNAEWRGFLSEFMKPLDLNLSEDEAVEDPEYNFLEDDDTPDREDLRNDKAVKITKKELQALMAELIEDAEAATEAEDFVRSVVEARPDPTVRDVPATHDDESLLFNHFRRQQLDQQMRMHVQLLAQVHLLASVHESLKATAETSAALLVELQCLSDTNARLFGRPSSFQAHNLAAAVNLLEKFPQTVVAPTPARRSKSWPIPGHVMAAIAHSKVFIYPRLLPVCSFRESCHQKDMFHPAEDYLLAMGLEQFLPLKMNVWELIREHMLPVRTVVNLKCRVKNLKTGRFVDNPVKHYFKHGSVPTPVRTLTPFNPWHLLPPIRQPPEFLPGWLLPVPFEATATTAGEAVKRSEKRAILPTLPVVTDVPSSPPAASPAMAMERMTVEPTVGFKTPSKPLAARNQASRLSGSPPTKIAPSPRTPTRETAGHSLSMPSISPLRASPLKQVSPILRKYSPKCLRKTGGNLPRGQTAFIRLLPKMPSPVGRIRIVSPGQRRIAPKRAPPVLDPSSSSPFDPAKLINVVGEPHKKVVRRIVDYEPEEELEMATGGVRQGSPTEEDVEAKANDTQESESEPEPYDEDVDTADDDVQDVLPDNEDDLAALMAASTTISSRTTHPRHRQSQHGGLRKTKSQKNEQRAVLAMLSGDLADSDALRDEREAAFAHSYLQRVKEAIGGQEELFEEFLRRLHEFRRSGADAVELYQDVCLLLKDFPELCEEFVGFLLPEQAKRCGKLMEFLSLSKMQVFIRKLEVHFSKHPQHLHKIVRTLAQVQQRPNPTMDELKAAVLPLLRGQQYLVEEFLQLFPDETPAESRMTDFEEVAVPEGDEDIEVDSDGYEVVELPDRAGGDRYGGQDCICNCHLTADKPRLGVNWLRHCVFCGLKFIDGCIYQQTGKALKPCHVVYLHPPRKSDGLVVCADPGGPLTSPSSSLSSLSPPVSKDSEDERDYSPPADSTSTTGTKEEGEVAASNRISEAKRVRGTTRRSLDFADVGAGSPPSEILPVVSAGRAVSPVSENEDVPVLSIPDTCEVSTSADDAATRLAESRAIGEWSRDHDRLLLQTCQQLGPGAEAFSTVASKLQKSVEEVGTRFQELMKLFSSQPHTSSTDVTSGTSDKENECNSDDADAQDESGRTTPCPSEDLTSAGDVTQHEQDPVVPVSANVQVASLRAAIAAAMASQPTVPPTSSKTADADSAVDPGPPEQQVPSSTSDELPVLSIPESSEVPTSAVQAKNLIVDDEGKVVVVWTRDHDRLLLQTCQQHGPGPEAFSIVTSKLQDKSVQEVATRFQELMDLFSEQSTTEAECRNSTSATDSKEKS